MTAATAQSISAGITGIVASYLKLPCLENTPAKPRFPIQTWTPQKISFRTQR